MGKQGSWGSWSGEWSYWRGAKAKRQANTQPVTEDRRESSRTVSFPSYRSFAKQDDKQVGVTPWKHVDQQAEEPIMTLAQVMQRAVTSCRKATNRLKKLERDYAATCKQWAQYQADIKKHFLMQKKTFDADSRKLIGEIESAQGAVQQAEEELRAIALAEEPKTSRERQAAESSAAAEEAWDTFLRADADPEMAGDPSESLLQQALEQADQDTAASQRSLQRFLQVRQQQRSQEMAAKTPTRKTGVARSPPGLARGLVAAGTSPGVPGHVAMYAGTPTQATQDPYMVSPSAMPPPLGSGASPTGARPKRSPAARLSVKEGARPRGPTPTPPAQKDKLTLADKLNQRRGLQAEASGSDFGTLGVVYDDGVDGPICVDSPETKIFNIAADEMAEGRPPGQSGSELEGLDG